MQVGVVGINYKLADLKLREKLAITCQRRFGPGCSAHPEQSFILLSTCNRTEIYFSSNNLAETHSYILRILKQDVEEEFDQKLYSYFNDECFYHLAYVVAGLDSAIVAETEIQGQVKIAYQKMCAYHQLPSELHFLFQKSLKIGKQVRSSISLGRGMPDVEHAIYSVGRHLFGNPENCSILFVGASDINLKILHFLKSKGMPQIAITNRTEKTAKNLARKYQIKMHPWNRLGAWPQYDWIIFGTKSPDYLIKRSDCVSITKQKLTIDLCVPRNVDPLVSRHSAVTLLNIDQLNRMLKHRRKKMSGFISDAEKIVKHNTCQQVSIFKRKQERHLSASVAIA